MRPRFAIGRCCCGTPSEGCEVCLDQFLRDVGTDIDTGSACGWDEVYGDPEIRGGGTFGTQLWFGEPGTAICLTEAPGNPNVHLQVWTQANREGATSRVYFDYYDGNNFKCLQMTWGFDGKLELIECSSGIETVVATAGSANARWYVPPDQIGQAYIDLCYSDRYAIANVIGPESLAGFHRSVAAVAYEWTASTGTNNTVGLGTSEVAGGEVRFSLFIMNKHAALDSKCPKCTLPCGGCSSYSPPFMKVRIQDIVNGACDVCDNFNIEYYVPLFTSCWYTADVTDQVGEVCQQRPSQRVVIDVFTQPYMYYPQGIGITLRAYSGPKGFERTDFKAEFVQYPEWWNLEEPWEPQDCAGFDELEIPLHNVSYGDFFEWRQCDLSQVRAFLSAWPPSP